MKKSVLIIFFMTFLLLASQVVSAQSSSNCAAGEALASQLEGDLGTAPSGDFTHLLCFEVNNDSDLDRYEIAYASVPIGQAQNLTDGQFPRMVVIGPNDQVIASSFKTISRWAEPLNNNNAPIRWLEIAIPAKVLAQSVNQYGLRLYDVAPNISDPFALTFSQNGAQRVVSSPVARFTLNSNLPRLIDEIQMDHDGDFNNNLKTIHMASNNDGPMLVYTNQGQSVKIGGGNHDHNAFDSIFDSAFEISNTIPTQGVVTLDTVDGFQVVETGAIKASYQINQPFTS